MTLLIIVYTFNPAVEEIWPRIKGLGLGISFMVSSRSSLFWPLVKICERVFDMEKILICWFFYETAYDTIQSLLCLIDVYFMLIPNKVYMSPVRWKLSSIASYVSDWFSNWFLVVPTSPNRHVCLSVNPQLINSVPPGQRAGQSQPIGRFVPMEMLGVGQWCHNGTC